MNLTLVPNWKQVLLHSWSVRLQIALGIMTAGDAAITYMADGKLGWSAAVFGWSLATTTARVIKQVAISGKDAGDDDE